MPTPSSDLNNLNQTSPFVELFTLDATALGGSVYRFTNHPSESGGPLSFGGQLYQPLPITSSGWDFTSTGTPPKPTLTVSNVNRTLLADVIGLGDLVGAKVTRIRTYAKYLDAASFTRRNLLNYSEDLSNAYWTKTLLSVTPNVAVGLSGAMTGDTITDSDTTNYGILAATVPGTYIPGTPYTYTAWILKDDVPKTTRFPGVRLQFGPNNNVMDVPFDTSTGEMLTVNPAGLITQISRSVTDGGDYWIVRLTGSSSDPAATSVRTRIYPAIGFATSPTATNATYGGARTGSITVLGQQVEQGTVSTAYQYTAANHQPFADSTKFIGPEVYIVEQKTGHNREFIQWQLTSIFDRLGMQLPRRQVLKDKGFPGVSRVRVTG